jgi:8-oxo-dGTP diphosphatase
MNEYIELSGCILQDEYGRMLLLHRMLGEFGRWELPGGKVEEDEIPEEAAVREAREELGVAVRLTRLVGTEVFEEDEQAYKFHWFQAVVVQGEVRTVESETFDDFDYVGLEDLPSLALSPNMLVLEQKLLSGAVVLEP